jgi:hypothetical protein
VLIDRLLASTKFVGTAVFCIYLADSAGYTVSCATQIGKDIFSKTSRTEFLQNYSLFLSIAGTLCVAGGAIYFRRRNRGLPSHAL